MCSFSLEISGYDIIISEMIITFGNYTYLDMSISYKVYYEEDGFTSFPFAHTSFTYSISIR
jgi:hypothetical protein